MSSDFELYAGDTREVVVNVVDQDGIKVNLTGGTVLWKMAKSDWKTNPAAVIVDKSSGVGQIALADGSFTVHLLSADTIGVEGSFYHEAQITLSDGTIGTPLVGKVKVKPNLIDPR
jgi:hypothetical protein